MLELGLGFYAISAISTLLSAQNKRLGDFAAGTIVVRDLRIQAPSAPLSSMSEIRLSEDERSLINRFLDRRAMLAPNQRRTLASQIAGVLRSRVDERLASLDDEALIENLGGLKT